MKNNTFKTPNHPQTIVTSPDDVDISIDSNLVELITLLWANGILTNFSCEGTSTDFKWKNEYLNDDSISYNGARDARAYISMPFIDESRDLILTLIDAFDGMGQSANSMWEFEFSHHPLQGSRISIRFPHDDIPKFVSFLRD